MKNFIYILFGLIILTGCETAPCECEEKSNGFVERTGQAIMLGSDASVEVVKNIDNAWRARDYETLKSLVADDAKLHHDDGRVSKELMTLHLRGKTFFDRHTPKKMKILILFLLLN